MPTQSARFQVTLSHAELVYLLKLFGADPGVGIDRDPFEALSPEQITTAHDTAAAALRARNLLRFDADQQPLLADDLLCVLSGYVDPVQLITAYRYTNNDGLPLAFFGYRRNGDDVIHTRPGDLLHEFTLVHGIEALVEALAEFCGPAKMPARAQPPRRVPAAAMAAARAFAEAGRAGEIVNVLNRAGMAVAEAEVLAANLITPSALTTLTILTKRDNQPPQRRDCVYWQSDANHSALLIVYERGKAAAAQTDAAPDAAPDEVLIADGSEATLRALFNEMAC